LPGSPHKLLNAYVHVYTKFTPLDVDDALLDAEADIRAPQLDGFTWAKIDKGSNSLRLDSTYKLKLSSGRTTIIAGSRKVHSDIYNTRILSRNM